MAGAAWPWTPKLIKVELPFADAMQQPNAGNRHGRAFEALEAEHRHNAGLHAAVVLLDHIVEVFRRPIVITMKKEGKFTLPSFGTFTVKKTKARRGKNPRTGEAIKIKAGKTVGFKASPTLKATV